MDFPMAENLLGRIQCLDALCVYAIYQREMNRFVVKGAGEAEMEDCMVVAKVSGT